MLSATVPVKKEVVLHHDSKVRAEVAQAQRVQVLAVNLDSPESG
jgi:hypothetical protein